MKLDPKVKNIAITTVACIVFVLLAAIVSLAIVFRSKIKDMINYKKDKTKSQANLDTIDITTEDADSSEPFEKFDLLKQGSKDSERISGAKSSFSDCENEDSRSTYY